MLEEVEVELDTKINHIDLLEKVAAVAVELAVM